MSFSHHLRSLAASIWDNQLTHPFVVALGNGTLPERKFKYYILQDARFLGDLARVFAAGAVKAQIRRAHSALPSWPKTPSSSNAASTKATAPSGR